MTDTRSRALLLIGLALAVVTGVLLYGLLATRSESAGGGPGVPVVVARSDLAAQTVLAAEHLETRTYPAGLAPAGAIADPATLVGQQLAYPVTRGMPLMRTVAAAGAATGRAIAGVTLERGRVLVAFPTADALTASGLIQAGDHVDILATMAAGSEPRATQKIVQDLTVVQVTGGTREQAARALVFAVDHQTSLVLKHLRDSGAIIDIVVRARSETDSVRTQVVDNTYIVTTYGLRR